MLSSKSDPALCITLRPSPRLLVLLSLLFSGAVFIPHFMAIPLWSGVLISLIAMLGYIVTLQKAGWRLIKPTLPQALTIFDFVQQIHYSETAGWQLAMSDGQMYQASLQQSLTVTPIITLLNFSLDHDQLPIYVRKQALALMSDSFAANAESERADQFRRLRVVLQTGGA